MGGGRKLPCDTRLCSGSCSSSFCVCDGAASSQPTGVQQEGRHGAAWSEGSVGASGQSPGIGASRPKFKSQLTGRVSDTPLALLFATLQPDLPPPVLRSHCPLGIGGPVFAPCDHSSPPSSKGPRLGVLCVLLYTSSSSDGTCGSTWVCLQPAVPSGPPLTPPVQGWHPRSVPRTAPVSTPERASAPASPPMSVSQ